jgi:hypothetical protein
MKRKESPRKTLARARKAFGEGDFEEALEAYEHFFDHALENSSAWYGVRLSYCLSEWAELGKAYPPAHDRLEQKAEEALGLFDQTKGPERFHDFHAICRSLGRLQEPLARFLRVHEADRELAQSIVGSVWKDLIEDRQWVVCSSYLRDPVANYKRELAGFKESMILVKLNRLFRDHDLESTFRTAFVRDVANILLVLKHNGRTKEFDLLLQRLERDMAKRGRESIFAEIGNRLA